MAPQQQQQQQQQQQYPSSDDPILSTSGLTEEQLAAAEQFFGSEELDELDAVNLDEVAPPPVRVPIVEYVTEPLLDGAGQPLKGPDGKPRVRRRATRRIAVIETFVPLDIYDRMLASRQRVEVLRRAKRDGPDGDEANRQGLNWMAEQVLAVWELTEPDMTLDRLRRGLDLSLVPRLFRRFFNQELRRLIIRARAVASISNAPDSPWAFPATTTAEPTASDETDSDTMEEPAPEPWTQPTSSRPV